MTKPFIVNIDAIKKELQDIVTELKNLPRGYLYQRNTRFTYRLGAEEIGITKKPEFISQLARKAYLEVRKIQLENNLNNSLQNYDARTPRALIADLPKPYQSVPESYFYHPSLPQWLANPPRFNTLNPENEKYVYNDVVYRSLSEREIARKLHENNLPFYADARFNTGDFDFTADFYIKNPFTGKIFMWEFFGAFNRPGYGARMNDKMAGYARNGYSENDNLIVTFEHHLRNTDRIQELIDHIIW